MVTNYGPQVIFEDKYLLVLNKPAGLIVAPTDTDSTKTLADILVSEFNIESERAGIVHRLDKDTSGVLLVAKVPQAFDNLQLQFKERNVKKEYLALVHGPVKKGGRVEGAVGRSPGRHDKFTVIKGGRDSVTEYEPIAQYRIQPSKFKVIFGNFNQNEIKKLEKMNYNQFTLLSCKPLTGRTHQIRVHLKYVGFPIVGDPKYTGRKVYKLDQRWVPRQFLHAKKIGFYHPASGEWMEFESALPEDLKKAFSNLELN